MGRTNSTIRSQLSCTAEARGKAHRDEGFLRAVDAGEDAEAVAALRAQVLQRLLDRCFLPVG